MKLTFNLGAALVTGLLLIGACGDDDGGGGEEAGGGFCEGAEDVVALDERSNELFSDPDLATDEEAFAAAMDEVPSLIEDMSTRSTR